MGDLSKAILQTRKYTATKDGLKGAEGKTSDMS